MKTALVLFCFAMLLLPGVRPAAAQPAGAPPTQASMPLMPLPARLVLHGGAGLAVDTTFSVALSGSRDARLRRAAERFVDRLARQTGVPMRVGLVDDPSRATLVLRTEGQAAEVQGAVEDESYTLAVGADGARLSAATPYGVLRGMETFLQLVRPGDGGFEVPAATVEDAPRYPWRGLLIDVARHWMPLDVLRRNLDAMAAVKLNVLHLHLSDDQGFRVESKVYPDLHRLGSGGLYYTQDEVRALIDYARDRGIRVVPEFDIPGHATSWLVGYPELAAAPGPYALIRRWGIFDPALDPTKESTYAFLDAFLSEMAALFPDAYFHIGGDEVTGKPWTESAEVQAFIRDNGLGDNHGLQAHFNRRVQQILQKNGKKMVGWDEIFHPDLPKDIVIQSWRGQASLAEAARQGYQGILSFGYYLDHMRTAAFHYRVDPRDEVAVANPGGRPLFGTWELWYQTEDGYMSGTVRLFGTPDDLAGTFTSDVNALPIALRDLTLRDSLLTFRFDAGEHGEGTATVTLSGDRWRGTMRVAGAELGLSGTRQEQAGGRMAGVTAGQKALILGGEACMWAEYVTPENVDSRIWPRLAAIAERLWSPAESTTDVADMYRRLDAVSRWLTWTGVTHESGYPLMLQRMTGHADVAPLRTLVDLVEPVRLYSRGRTNGKVYTQATPLNRPLDAARPESETARRFNASVDSLLAGQGTDATRAAVRGWLTRWRDNHAALAPLAADNHLLERLRPLSQLLAQLAALGLDAEAALHEGRRLPAADRARHVALIQRAAQPHDEALLMVVSGIQRLVTAAY